MTEQFRGERTLVRVFIGESDHYVRYGRVRRGVGDAD